MSNPQQIEYKDLIAPKRLVEKVLLPGEIPIHPSVYDWSFAYTPEFIQEVRAAVPDSMTRDLSEIERILGAETGLEITKNGLLHRGNRLLFSDISFNYDPNKKTLGVAYWDANIDIDKVNVPTHIDVVVERAQEEHPMPLDKLRQYAFEQGELGYVGEKGVRCYSWYTHNILFHGLPLMHYCQKLARTPSHRLGACSLTSFARRARYLACESA